MGSDLSGRRYGRYRLLTQLAHGGMGEVYLARAEGAAGVDRTVVLKRIRDIRAQDERVKRMFVSEARVAMGLTHGNIAQVFDFGEVDGEYFMVMELVDGPSLWNVLVACRKQKIRIPYPLTAWAMQEAARGLHHAHQRTDDSGRSLGIVHRDVSPQNVLVAFDGQVKIVDFGIARARDQVSETRPGVLRGKYIYFSPEQASSGAVDRRTDIYAAGVVLYQLVTGKLPVEGDVKSVVRRIIAGTWARPSTLEPELPAELEEIILRAMAKDPAERYQTAQELEVALGTYLHARAGMVGPEDLATFLKWLFAEHLAEDGRSADVPLGYEESMSPWRRQAVAPASQAEPEEQRGETATLPAPVVPAELAPSRRRLAVAFGLGAAAAAVAAAFVLGRGGGGEPRAMPGPPEAIPGSRATQSDTSTPPGPSVEPARDPSLDRKPSRVFVPFGMVGLEARLPVEATTVRVDSVPFRWVELDPSKSYRVSLRGQATLGGVFNRHFTRLYYYADGPGGASQGVLTGEEPLNVDGMRRLGLVIGDPAGIHDNNGSLTVEVRRGRRLHQREILYPSRDVFRASQLGVPIVSGLAVTHAYQVGLEAEDGAPPDLLFIHQVEVGGVLQAAGSVDHSMGQLRVGRTLGITGASRLVLFRFAATPPPAQGWLRVRATRQPD